MKRLFLIVAFVGLTVISGYAQTEIQPLPNDASVRKGRLENGLTYYLRHNERPKGRAEFYLATNVGAIQETPDQDGLAHFLEHMCFNGTKNFPGKALLNYLQSIGASFGGNVNASTGVEQTVYMLNNIPLLRESVVDTCILIMHDYSHFVTNSAEEIDKERGVIIEERRARRDANMRMYEKSLPYYYGDSKYSRCTLIGSQENLETFKPESLRKFYSTWYRPDLQALIIVGDIDLDKTEEKIKKIFSDIPAAINPKNKEEIKIKSNHKPSIGIITDPEATSTNVEVYWKRNPLPKELNNTAYGKASMIINNIIESAMNERLSDITAKSDAPFLSASFGIGKICNPVEVVMGTAGCREGEAIPSFKALYSEIRKLKEFGIEDSEIQRAKDNILSSYESAAKKASTRKNSELVYELINNFFFNDDYMAPEDEYKLIQNILPRINKTIIDAACSKIITDTNMVILCKAPEKAAGLPSENDFINAINEVNSSTILANKSEKIDSHFIDSSKLKGSKIRKEYKGIYNTNVWELKNGVKVILYPTNYEKDRISINLYKNGGKSLISTADLDSFDDNVYGMFMKNSGISKFPATVVGKMLSGKNVSVSPYIGSRRHGITGVSSVKDFSTLLELTYLYFAEPRFDSEEYNHGIKYIEAVLPNLINRPEFKFQKELLATVYGNNPRLKLLSKETLERANLATIKKNYQMLFNDAAGATIIITGDFSPENIRPLIQKYIGSIKKGHKPLNWKDEHIDILPGTAIKDFKAKMQTPMTTVSQLYSAPMKYSFENEVALNAVSYILNMRYVNTMREEEGGTYGAQTSTDISIEPKQEATINISFNAKPSSADKLHEIASKEIHNLAQEGPKAEEFEMTYNNMLKKIPEGRIHNSYWANAIQQYELYNFDCDKEYEKAIKSLTPQAIRNIVKEILSSGNFIEVIMRPGETGEKE